VSCAYRAASPPCSTEPAGVFPKDRADERALVAQFLYPAAASPPPIPFCQLIVLLKSTLGNECDGTGWGGEKAGGCLAALGLGVSKFLLFPKEKAWRLGGTGGWRAGVQGIARPQMPPSSPPPASSLPDPRLLSSAAFGSCFSMCRVCEPG